MEWVAVQESRVVLSYAQIRVCIVGTTIRKTAITMIVCMKLDYSMANQKKVEIWPFYLEVNI